MAMKRGASKKRNKDENDIPMSDEFMDLVKKTNKDEVVSKDISFASLGEWSTLPGKRLKRPSESNPLVSVGHGSGIDDATCLEVEVIDASIYLPLTDKKLQATYSSKQTVEEKKEASGPVVKSSKKSKLNQSMTAKPVTQPEPTLPIDTAKAELESLKKQRKSGEVSEEQFVSMKTDILKKMEKLRRAAQKKMGGVSEEGGGMQGGNSDQKDSKKKNKKRNRKDKSKKIKKSGDSGDDEGDEEEDEKAAPDTTTTLTTPPLWAKFGLHEQLGCALAKAGFNSPTPIQSAVLKAALGTSNDGPRDVMVRDNGTDYTQKTNTYTTLPANMNPYTY
jgi:hypothetical protein